MPLIDDSREELLNRILDSTPNLIYVFDVRENRMVYSNRTTLEHLGYSCKEAEDLGADFPKAIIHPDDFPAVMAMHAEQTATMSDSEVRETEYRLLTRDRGYRWIRNQRRVFARDGAGNVTRVISTCEDVSDRRAILDQLSQNERRYRSIVNNISDGVFIHDAAGTILDCNEEACRSLGYSLEELLGENLALIDAANPPEQIAERMAEILQTGSKIFDTEHLRKDGSRVLVNINSRVISGTGGAVIFQAVSRDLTEHNMAQDALVKMEKLESLGRLAAGIAHEFNNLFGGIFGYIDLAREKTEEPAARGYLEKALNTMDRAKYLTRYILTFAKGGTPWRKVGDLAPVIRESIRAVLEGKNIALRIDLAPQLLQCNFDRDQVGQVLQNVIANACEAMPQGGSLRVSADNCRVHEGEVGALPGGNYVRIAITDSGPGIEEKILGRIFDPFFTTRPGHNGIGLTIAYSVVSQHGGTVVVKSNKGSGTAVTLFLPAIAPVAADVPPAPVAAAGIHSGMGSILIMDDEEIVLETVGAALVNLGYTVACAKNGKRALDLFRSRLDSGAPFAAVVLDLLVPGDMGGMEVAAEIRKISPDITIVAASGYSDAPAITHPADYGFSGSVCKPFRIAELLGKIEFPKREMVPG
jgi:PAS domain S-box-containing protein